MKNKFHTYSLPLMVTAFIALIGIGFGTGVEAFAAERFGFGTTPTKEEIVKIDIDIMPDGRGLPPGGGNAVSGRAVYDAKCAACHGANLEGIAAAGAAALIGGRGSIGTPQTKKTVESFWPYATTLFDYVRRAMPFNEPGSLSDAEVYALSAYILYRGNVIGEKVEMNAETLAKVKMPNRDGFIISDGKPDILNFRKAIAKRP